MCRFNLCISANDDGDALMSDMRPIYDDDIDLFEFFETLWAGKWIITTFSLIVVLLGSGFIFIKDSVYESKMFFSADTIPPFYNSNKASTDFQKKFYSISIFENWKKNNGSTSLVFEDFSLTEVIDSFVLLKKEDEQLVTLGFENEIGSFILIKTDQLPVLDDLFKYAQYINEILRKEYVDRAKNELKIIEARFTNFDSVNSDIIQTVLSIDRYIVSAEKGANVLTFQRPTMPEKVSPKSLLILAMSVIFGGMMGMFFIFFRNAVRKRKEQLVKA